MTSGGVHSGGMRGRDGDEEVIRVVREGRVPDDRPELTALASLMAELRSVHDAEPAPPVGPELAELIRTGAPAADPAVTGPGPARPSLLRSARAKAGFAAVAASLGLVGGLGAAGALPPPVQRVVASTADVIGLDFPRPPVTPKPGGPGAGDGSGPPSPPVGAPSPTTSCPTPSSSTTTPFTTTPSTTAPSVRPDPGAEPPDPACAPTSSSTTAAPGPTTTSQRERPTTSTTTAATTSTSSPRSSTTARSS